MICPKGLFGVPLITSSLFSLRRHTVKAAYGVSWLYLIGDVSYETYKAKHNGPTALDLATGLSDNGRLGLVAAKRGM